MDLPLLPINLTIHLLFLISNHTHKSSLKQTVPCHYYPKILQKVWYGTTTKYRFHNSYTLSIDKLFLPTLLSMSEDAIKPWINKFRADVREALGLNIAKARIFDSPILGTQVPTGTAQIGCWSIGNELEQCLKFLQMPEN